MDTRKRILKTALKLFVEKGFAEVSINDLILEVGIAKGGFYHHFKSKDQLINEIIEKVIFPYLDDIINSIDKCQGSAKEKLFHSFEKQSQAETFLKTNFHVDNISNRSLIILMIECIKRYESMSAQVIEFTEQLLGRIESIIEEGKRRGELLNTIDSKSLSLYIVSSLEGALFIWVMNPKTDLKMLFENNFQYVWSSIKN